MQFPVIGNWNTINQKIYPNYDRDVMTSEKIRHELRR